jgi:methylaspartate mutase sigma subunit
MIQEKVLLTTIASDSHGWNLVFMEMFLQEKGWPALNLGTCVPAEMVVKCCGEGEIDLVVVSTVNGHGWMEGLELAGRIQAELGEQRPWLAIGGKLGVSAAEEEARAEELRRAGYDGVFYGPSALEEFTVFLDRNLAEDVTTMEA